MLSPTNSNGIFTKKIYGNSNGNRIIKWSSKNNKEASYFQISKYIKVIVIKIGWYWHKFRHIEQWDREMRNKPTQQINTISQLIFDKDSRISKGKG